MKLPKQTKPLLRIPAPVSENTGLGDAIKNVTSRLGIPHCGGCEKRAHAFNRWVSFQPIGKKR